MSCEANNIILNPVNVFWQIEASSQIDLTGLTGVDVKGGYFTLNSPNTSYYVWFDDGVELDPAPVGLTGISVTVAGDNDTAATLATALQTALDAETDFTALVKSNTKVDVTNAAVGEVTDPADVDSGVSITVCRRGKDYDLGLLQGDLEPSFSPSNFTITAHSTGLTPIGILNQGFESIEVSTTLQETNKSKLKDLYKIYGGVVTPGAGTEVFGAGSAALGKNLLVDAARLVMRPVNTINSDLSYDFNFMLALPVPDTLTFSGENPRTLSVTWNGFIDLSIDSKVNAVLVGDAAQADLKV